MIVVAFCCVTIPLLAAALGVAYSIGRADERARNTERAHIRAAAARCERSTVC